MQEPNILLAIRIGYEQGHRVSTHFTRNIVSSSLIFTLIVHMSKHPINEFEFGLI
jgi:hypothetical protein